MNTRNFCYGTSEAKTKTIFLAFAGEEISQPENAIGIQDGYECWNLKKFSLDSFLETIKVKIPPVNNNVLRNYKVSDEVPGENGLGENTFKHCSWGLLIPDCLDDAISNSYTETIFLLNLYSPSFLYPLFYVSDFGITRPVRINKPIMTFAHFQNQSQIFKTKEFVSFFKTMLPQSQYATWQLDRIQKWNKEDWRLFVAAMLYSGLKEYDNSKSSFGWQRESADMATILESLFTAADTKNEEVGYRLRKRMAALLSWKIKNIEDHVKELYTERSSFVHGSFFAQIAKETKRADTNIPIPDFNHLYSQKECVRLALVAYFHLAMLLKSSNSHNSVMGLLEESIINTDLRIKVNARSKKILSLIPEPVFKLV